MWDTLTAQPLSIEFEEPDSSIGCIYFATGINMKHPCAIVPLKPNELSHPGRETRLIRLSSCNDLLVVSSTGIWNCHFDATGIKIPFNLWNVPLVLVSLDQRYYLSYVLANTSIPRRSTSATKTRPEAAAAGSKCPMTDFMEAICIACSSRGTGQLVGLSCWDITAAAALTCKLR